MEDITHKHVGVGGLNLHVAEIGSEIWYSWRYQMIAFANAGFHAIAPDYRGYGLSDQPSELEKATYVDLAKDMVGLLDAFSIKKVFIVGKDFGGFVAYLLGLLYPDRVTGIVTLGAPYRRPVPETFQPDLFPEGFYMRRWQEPGRAEEDFTRFDVKTVVKNIYILFSRNELPVAPEGKEIMDLVEPSTPLPHWFSEDDLKIYASLYEKSGFGFPLQLRLVLMAYPLLSVHLNFNFFQFSALKWILGIKLEDVNVLQRMWEQLSYVIDFGIQAPCLLIVGSEDYLLKFPGMELYITSEILKTDVPNLEIKFISGGCHFVQEQFPEKVNNLLLGFLNQQLHKQNLLSPAS
eukprot:Gb_16225 [translate_table: standard]